MRIRPCTPADAETLALVGAATFLQTFAGVLDGAAVVAHCASAHSAQRYRELFAEGYELWLAEADPGSAPVGYAMTGPCTLAHSRPGDVELKRIYVLDRFHGAGPGAALIRTVLDLARQRGAPRMLVGAYSGNAKAQAFYAKAGFARIGERQFKVGAQAYEDHVFALDLT